MENDQLCNGKPICATDSYQVLQDTYTIVNNAIQIYMLDLKEPFINNAVYLIGCSPQALGLSITDTHLSS
jgi:hypothetical protein